MRYRNIVIGLIILGTLLVLVACGETGSPDPESATTVASTTLQATATSDGIGEQEPIPSDATQPNETPSPDSSGYSVVTPEPATSERLRELESPAFYDRDGIRLEHYWPADKIGNLSADETEVLVYNTTDGIIEFKSPVITFVEDGVVRVQTSGTWEKFPSKESFERSEYILIPPSAYEGEPLLVAPGEKAKLHWHLDGDVLSDTAQSVTLDFTIVTRGGELSIASKLIRISDATDQFGTVTAETPAPVRIFGGTESTSGHGSSTESGSTASAGSNVLWSFNGSAWAPNGTAPSCPEPLGLETPVDLSNVTSALWPGQQRGAYVAHGGFRFDDNVDNNVTVRTPMGSHLVQAASYLESGKPQYLLFFSVPCGFFYRFDHVLEVPPEIAEALKDIPAATSGDSRTTYLNPPLWIEQGEIVGTAVGISETNIFVDFGLYDVRQPNNATPDPAWADLFAGDKEFGHYGVCFFDYLPGTDGDTMRSLPTGKEGKTSDYCDE